MPVEQAGSSNGARDAGRRGLRTVRLAASLVWRADRRRLIVILVATTATACAVAGQLLAGRWLLDTLAVEGDVTARDLAPGLVTLGVLMLIGALSQAVASEFRILLGERVLRNTMDDILDVSTAVDLEAFEQTEFHDRLQRARVAAGGQTSAVVFGLVTIVSTIVIAVGVVIVLLAVAPVLVPMALVAYVPITLVNLRNNRARYALERDLTELNRERGYVEFLLTERATAKEIRAYGVSPTLRVWHRDMWAVRLERLNELVRKRLGRTALGATVTTLAIVATLSLAVILAGRGSISIGDAAIAVVGLQQLSGRLGAAGAALSNVHAGVTFLQDFEQFRATLPTVLEARPTEVPSTPPVTLTVDRVGYRYPEADDDALREVSFELRRGQIMAVVGANGSGKSTLAKVLCGLLPPSSGSVRWDGVDLATCDPDLVRAQIAAVFQDYTQYYFTIRQAVALGDAARLDDEAGIEEAARLAGLDEVTAGLPDGIDTRLGRMFSNGTELSVGQWQRVAIARALFRDAPFLLLDEPSASLDPRGEAELFALLRSICDDRIVVFVSHRFATVRSADVVLVLDDGSVVETGSHAELMAAGGVYHELYMLQAERFGIDP